MFEAKDSEGLWWRFSVKPTMTNDGWFSDGHVSSLPNHQKTKDQWEDSLVGM
jgi:hypothetical protein